MKEELAPMRNWIVEKKMADKPALQKDEFTTLLGDWIVEYSQALKEANDRS